MKTVAEVQTRLKAIKNTRKSKPKWNLKKKIKGKENNLKGMIWQKCTQIDGFTGSLEDS